ncbi:DUF4244 domain-containing protein [Gulosibacter sediminis]|uniref:DUF4244 domain-containing protein n=1 Tax=Gulosibacter sediminis TaxID=1729695 RepID=UPI0024ACF5E5|nr:DUF4244 domain-containing protein [Gulosibacter sediminis]
MTKTPTPDSPDRNWLQRLLRDEQGAATAEYAIVIMAAVALAGVLVAVVQSDAVRQIIEDLVISAFG